MDLTRAAIEGNRITITVVALLIMAGALAFRTLFALLPVLVVGTVVVRAFRGFDSLLERCAALFATMELDAYQITLVGGETGTLSDFLLELIEKVEEINLAAIGWVGMVVVVYSAIQLMVTIEKTFNTVYRAPEGRPWMRRLTTYWTVLTCGPAAIVLAMWAGSRLENAIEGVEGWAPLLRGVEMIWGFLVTWILLFIFYKLVPNTKVAIRPALIGAFVAAALVEVGQEALGFYFNNAVLIPQLYGSLGLIPVFMFWVYVMWLFILFGLQVSATLQMLGGRRLEEIEKRKQRTGLVDPASVLVVMQVVARHFATARVTTSREVADDTSIPEATISRMFEWLVDGGFLHRLETEDGAVALARPPDQISADELIAIGFRMVDEGVADDAPPLVEKLRQAQMNLARQVTLAAL